MSYTADELLVLATKFDKLAYNCLVKTAKAKLDPKAKVRNRGTACIPAERAKDKKDHFPINDEAQARNALARVHQYNKVPSWYGGSLKGLQELVARKVKSKYPKIEVAGKKDKKSYLDRFDNLIQKFALGEQPEVEDYSEGQSIDPDADPNQPNQSVSPAAPAAAPAAKPAAKPNKPAMSSTDKALLQSAQEALNKLQYKGKDGKPLNADGLLGPNTQFAINAYITKNKDRIPSGFNHAGPALYTMIARDASGENKEPAKTVKAPVSKERAEALIDQASDALEKLLPAYQSGQMMQNQAAWLGYITPFYQSNSTMLQQINALVANPQIDEGQKKELGALIPKLNANVLALTQYYQILSKPAAPPAAR